MSAAHLCKYVAFFLNPLIQLRDCETALKGMVCIGKLRCLPLCVGVYQPMYLGLVSKQLYGIYMELLWKLQHFNSKKERYHETAE